MGRDAAIADGLSWNLGQSVDVRRRTLQPDVTRDNAIGMTAAERQLFANNWLWHVPLKSIDAMDLRRFAPAYFEMLGHPSYDVYWETFDIEARHGEVDVPAYHFTGWYDPGSIEIPTRDGVRRERRVAARRSDSRPRFGPSIAVDSSGRPALRSPDKP